MPNPFDEIGKPVGPQSQMPDVSRPMLQIDPNAQALTHGGVGLAKGPKVKEEVPSSILDGLGKWARNEITAKDVRKFLPQGWTIDRRINALSVGIGVFDPQGDYHFISNADF